ncbi:MAG: ABZJ_00895 family protein [Ectothiorhodospiraceae bacterium]|nr:ABZJ_00895 family protein [Ectothiorhodospiraceae bacterium]MCH8503302.1 ABZJ_00895 family protein [Ectothiorhodospiraceae bacterium]
MTAQNKATSSLAPYHYRFAWIYLVLVLGSAAALALLEYLLDTELDVGSGTAVGLTLAAGFAVITKFLNDHKRVPDTQERRSLIWAGIGLSYLVSVFSALVILLVLFRQNFLWVLVYLLGHLDTGLAVVLLVVFGIATAFLYGGLYLIYGPFARRHLKQIERKAARAVG